MYTQISIKFPVRQFWKSYKQGVIIKIISSAYFGAFGKLTNTWSFHQPEVILLFYFFPIIIGSIVSIKYFIESEKLSNEVHMPHSSCYSCTQTRDKSFLISNLLITYLVDYLLTATFFSICEIFCTRLFTIFLYFLLTAIFIRTKYCIREKCRLSYSVRFWNKYIFLLG